MVLAAGISVHDPRFEIEISNTLIDVGVQELIESVEYESTDGIADVAKLKIKNPDFVLTDLKLFQPGNEMNIKFGYGRKLKHIGRVEIVRAKHNFPSSGMPVLNVIGYTADSRMMENSPEKGHKGKKAQKRTYGNEIGEILEQVASRYNNFGVDADGFVFTKAPVQKAGLSDYDFVVGLANLAGAAFWVDGDPEGEWLMNWRLPDEKGVFRDQQDEELNFVYGGSPGNTFAARGDESVLLEFDPEFAIKDSRTKLKVIVRNPNKGKTFIEEFTEDDVDAEDLASDGKADEVVEAEHVTGGAAKLIFGNLSIEIVPNKKFKTGPEVKIWAKQWFRRNRENFVIGKGKLIGISSLFARQTHRISNVGQTFSGRYYFARVRHMLTASSGYTVDFSARKVLP